MYKVIANVSGKRARLVPSGFVLGTADRLMGDVSQEDALANKDGLTDAIRGLLEDKGITDADLYSIELPDDLAPFQNNRALPEGEQTDAEKATAAKGPVTKPKNPKKGETGDKGEQEPSNQSPNNQPSETRTQTPGVDETKITDTETKKD